MIENLQQLEFVALGSVAHICSDTKESFTTLTKPDFELPRKNENVPERVPAGPRRRARVLDGPRLTGNGKDGLVPVEAWSDDLPRGQELTHATRYPGQVNVWRELESRQRIICCQHEIFVRYKRVDYLRCRFFRRRKRSKSYHTGVQ